MTQKMNNTVTICQLSYMPDYQVKEVMEENHSINDEDIIDSFKAEDGAEWYGYVEESFTLSADDIRDAVKDAGYDADKMDEMTKEEKYRMVMGLVDEEILCNPDNYCTITECEKDCKCDFIGIEENVDGDFDIYIEVKFKFTLDGDEVKKKLIKRITLSDATDEQIENAILSNPKEFGFSDLPLDREDLIEAAMTDLWWKSGYSEYVNMVDEPVSFRDYVETDIDDSELSVSIDREDEEVSGEIYIEFHWSEFLDRYDNWLPSDMEIEVE